ncbi:MAG: amidohydrolase [Planctomycetes bacterium]|nr:amidohydrolase [Planctomycetota bacterium]
MKRRRWLKILGLALLAFVATVVVFHGRLVHAFGGASAYEPNEYATRLSATAKALVDAALSDLDADRIFDDHVHIPGLGADDSGCRVNPKMLSWAHPKSRVQFLVYADASRITDLNQGDRQYVERLVALARGMPKHGRLGLLAFDANYAPDGTLVEERTEMYTPNTWPIQIAREFPDIFTPIASVHPYRDDAALELARAAEGGAHIVKWLPNAMGIDPADPRCDAFYAEMVRLDMVLLSHAGTEHAVDAAEAQEFGNPLRLRRALDRGVKVIVAHCGSLGESTDLDDPAGAQADNFDLFLRLMDEPRYVGLAFGEISAMTQINRCGRPLEQLLARTDLHERLVNGSDYPLPAINVLFSTCKLARLGYITDDERALLNEIYDVNPLLFDLVLKRCLKHPERGTRFPASVFMVREGLQR